MGATMKTIFARHFAVCLVSLSLIACPLPAQALEELASEAEQTNIEEPVTQASESEANGEAGTTVEPPADAMPVETSEPEALPVDAGEPEALPVREPMPENDTELAQDAPAPENEISQPEQEPSDQEEPLDPQASKSGRATSCTWTLSDAGTLTITAGKATNGNPAGLLRNSDIALSEADRSRVKSVVYKGGVKPANDGMGLLVSCDEYPNVTSFDLRGMDTSSITDLSFAFNDFYALKTVDLTGIDTRYVTSMAFMFGNCGSLTTVKGLGGLNASKVTSMLNMFGGCYSLKSVQLPAASRVTEFGSMFYYCSALESIDISMLDMTAAQSNEYATSGMFLVCDALSSITLGKKSSLKYADIPEGPWLCGSKTLSKEALEGAAFGSTPGTWSLLPYSDLPVTHWAKNVILTAVERGFMSGYTKGASGSAKFGPDDKVTRGQVAVVLWNMAGRPKAGASAKNFADVASGAYYYNAVRWASSVGVVNGYGDGRTFGPNDNVTRQQLAVMLANFASRVRGLTVAGSAKDYASMSDASTVSSYATRSVGWCFRSKILTGSANMVKPLENATRAQLAKMVVFLDNMKA